MSEDVRYFTKTKLKRRGWSETLIKTKLGDAHKRVKNPFNSNASDLLLWEEKAVIEKEQDQDFQTHLARREKQSNLMKSRSEKSRQELFSEIESMDINIAIMGAEELKDFAIKEWRKEKRGNVPFCPSKAHSQTLARWMVNYIRHNLTRYDQKLEEIIGKTGRKEAVTLIRQRVFKEIARTYPEFSAECQRQLDRRVNYQ